MSFSAGWLELREAYDRAARNDGLARAFCAGVEPLGAGPIVDLGGGTGSTARALAERFGLLRQWIVLDNDPALLARGRELAAAGAPPITFERADLSGDLDRLIPDDAAAITTSALLDLVSPAWLDRLAGVLRQRRLIFYAALSYDGRLRWRPGDVFDDRIKRLFDAHQRTDKGFGPALGPDAAGGLASRLAPLGGSLSEARSDWDLLPTDRSIQTELLNGYLAAALAIAPDDEVEINDWYRQRLRRIDDGRSRHRVGHVDHLWIPDT